MSDPGPIRLNDIIQGVLRRLIDQDDGGRTGDGSLVATVLLSDAERREIQGVLAWDADQRSSYHLGGAST